MRNGYGREGGNASTQRLAAMALILLRPADGAACHDDAATDNPSSSLMTPMATHLPRRQSLQQPADKSGGCAVGDVGLMRGR
jgi:hypothetical protein